MCPESKLPPRAHECVAPRDYPSGEGGFNKAIRQPRRTRGKNPVCPTPAVPSYTLYEFRFPTKSSESHEQKAPSEDGQFDTTPTGDVPKDVPVRKICIKSTAYRIQSDHEGAGMARARCGVTCSTHELF